MTTKSISTVRLATMDQLIETIFGAHFAKVPSKDTLRQWLDDAGVRRFKANQTAKRGGGVVHYVVSDVEKFLSTRTTLKPGLRKAA